MSVTNDAFGRSHQMLVTGFRMQAEVRTLTGAIVLGLEAAPVQYLDANGAARTVDMPASVEGTMFYIKNEAAGAFALTLRNELGVAITGGSVAQNQIAIVHRVNGVWRMFGNWADLA